MSRMMNQANALDNTMTPPQQPQAQAQPQMQPMVKNEPELVLNKKQLMSFLIILAILYVVLSLPKTFTVVGQALSENLVGSSLSENLDIKLVLVHGAVFLLLAYGLTRLMKRGTFDKYM